MALLGASMAIGLAAIRIVAVRVVAVRVVAVHQGLVQVFDSKAFEQREYGMCLVEVVINCRIVSVSASIFRVRQQAAYQC